MVKLRLRKGHEWAEFIWEGEGLVRLSVEETGVSQTFCRRDWDLSKMSAQGNGISQIFICMWDWSNFLQKRMGLVNCSEEVSGIDQTFYRRQWD